MRNRLVIIFHGIGEPHSWVPRGELPYWCSERDFLSLLDSIPETSAQMQLPIEITFDDGNVSDISTGAPAIKDRGLNASFFVCAGRLDKPGYLSSAQLAELVSAGMTVGSHGWDHVDWRTVRRDDELDREVVQARDCIADALSRPVDSVAIPFGSYDRRVWLAASKAFKTIFTSDGGLAPMSGAIVPRETYTTEWESHVLRRLGARPTIARWLQATAARVYKRNRRPLR